MIAASPAPEVPADVVDSIQHVMVPQQVVPAELAARLVAVQSFFLVPLGRR